MGKRLLVLDADAEFIKEHMAELRAKFNADFINNPDHVIELLETAKYDMILVNIEKGANTGLKVCQSIRNHPILVKFRIAVISSKDTRDSLSKSDSGAIFPDIYLIKPLTSAALASALTYLATGEGDTQDSILELNVSGKNSKESAKEKLETDLSVLYDFNLIDELGKKISNLEGRLGEKTKELTKIEGILGDKNIELNTLEGRLREKTMELLAGQKELQEAHHQNRIITLNLEESEKQHQSTEEIRRIESENIIKDLKAKLHEKTMELLLTQQDIQELQRQNDTITVNFEELEKQQKDSAGLHQRLQEAEEQLKRLESDPMMKEDRNVLRDRLKQALGEKQDLLMQLEAMAQDVSNKNQQVFTILQSKEKLQEQLITAESRYYNLEQDYAERIASGRKVFESKLGALRRSKDEVWERIMELEQSYSAITKELEPSLTPRHSETQGLMIQTGKQKSILLALTKPSAKDNP
ncbi:MAG: hypothetical protein FWG12_06760 [Holophagaceae bacterium]|nr:hypothetical protein [Holophagaceae bacterium]